MMKKIISILATITLLCIPSVTTFGVHGNYEELEALMFEIEEEILLCFNALTKDNEIYSYLGNGLIDQYPSDITKPFRDIYFPQTIEALTFIGTNAPQTAPITAQNLFLAANEAYQLARISEKNANPVTYHNICHGLQVMMMSGVLFESVILTDADASAKYVVNHDSTKALIMFAGLFHDAGHPGYSNSTFQVDELSNLDLHKNIASSASLLASNQVFGSDARKKYVELGMNVMALAQDNQGPKFALENIHSTIAIAYYEMIFAIDLADGALQLIKDSILQTNMAAPNVLRTAIDEYALTNIESDEELAKFPDQFANGAMVDFRELVHVVDIGMNGTTNFTGVTEVVKLVVLEFYEELSNMKAIGYTYDQLKRLGVFGPVCGNDYDEIWSKGQTGFDWFIGTVVKNEAIFTTETIPEYFKVLTKKLDKMDGESPEKVALTAKVGAIAKFQAKTYDDLKSYLAYPLLNYLRVNLGINDELFVDETMFKANHASFMRITDLQWASVCTNYDRLLRHIRAII